MTTQNKNVPALRFPAFQDDWKEKKLGNVAELTSSKRVYLSDYVSSGIPFYRGKEITELKRNIEPSDILYITEKSYLEFKQKFGVPEEGDILITAVGTLGNVLRIKNQKPFYFKDGNLIWFRKIAEASDFLEILLENNKKEIEKSSIGSTQRALTMVELNKLKFQFPTLPEQQKIAAFLTAVEEKIQQLARKKDLLEQYKKGVMQKIFNQEIRFKDDNGNDFADWEERRLGDFTISSAFGPRFSSSLYSKSGNVLTLRTTDMNADGIINYNTAPLADIDIEQFKEHILQENDLIISRSGTIGITGIFQGYKIPVIPGAFLIRFRMNINKVSPAFIKLLLNSTKGRNQIESLSAGGVQKNLTSTSVLNMSINFPSLPEQQKIADFLSAIDDKINLVNQQLEKTKEYKKGLLQQMFV